MSARYRHLGYIAASSRPLPACYDEAVKPAANNSRGLFNFLRSADAGRRKLQVDEPSGK
jgi:hypothetical protein